MADASSSTITLENAAAPQRASTGVAAPARDSVTKRRRLRMVLLVVVPLLVLVGAGLVWLTGGRYVSTDDAYVKADKVAITAEVSGKVAQIAVDANQHVTRGQLLFTIDEEPYRIALQRAEANLATARNDIESMRAQLAEKRAALKAAQDSLSYFTREFDRQQQLAARSVVSVSKLDEARHNLENAQQQVAMNQHDIGALLANLGGDGNIATEDHPRVRQARAERDQAELNLRRTRIVSPASGTLANFDVQPGEYVTAAQPVFSLVSDERVWVEANLKETDLTYVRPGQTVTLTVDAYPGHDITAKVESINPGTGSEFSLLPAQNATGNWVKVVQRVPVRIAVTPDPDYPLVVGMSSNIEIDTRHQRSLPLFGTALARAIGNKK
jgi:membrane fusion protein, multidrug efflux system